MIDKPKRSSRRLSVIAIESMIVLVALVATLSVLFPSPTLPTQVQAEPEIIVPAAVVAPASLPATNHLVEESYYAALDYVYREDYSKSLDLLDAIVEADPNHYWAHVSLSYVLYELGDYAQAMEIATNAIALNPADGVALNNRCLLRAYIGDYQGALEDCNQSIAVSPDYDYSYNNRCYVYIQLGELELAKNDCYEALQKGHRMPEWVDTNLGEIYRLSGPNYYDAAIDYYLRALRQNPEFADAYAHIGDLMSDMEYHKLAVYFYTEYQKYAGVHYRPIYGEKLASSMNALANR